MSTATKAAHQELGRRGEDLAAKYLAHQGFVVLVRNWRCREGELDLVLTDGRELLVVEVKTRAGTGFGAPIEAVDEEKARRIRMAANKWLAKFHVTREVTPRFDVMSIIWPPGGPPRIQHFREAF